MLKFYLKYFLRYYLIGEYYLIALLLIVISKFQYLQIGLPYLYPLFIYKHFVNVLQNGVYWDAMTNSIYGVSHKRILISQNVIETLVGLFFLVIFIIIQKVFLEEIIIPNMITHFITTLFSAIFFGNVISVLKTEKGNSFLNKNAITLIIFSIAISFLDTFYSLMDLKYVGIIISFSLVVFSVYSFPKYIKS